MGNALELFREYKATKRGELFSFTEQNINKMNVPQVTKGSGKLMLAGLSALILVPSPFSCNSATTGAAARQAVQPLLHQHPTAWQI